jgi:hypothetical protein
MTVEKRKDCVIRTHTNYEKTILTFYEALKNNEASCSHVMTVVQE